MKTKKLLSIILTLAMVLSLIPTVAFAQTSGADLTISTVNEWNTFAQNVLNGNLYDGKTVVLSTL